MRPGIVLVFGSLGFGTLALLAFALFSPGTRVTSAGEPSAVIAPELNPTEAPADGEGASAGRLQAQAPHRAEAEQTSVETVDNAQAAAELREERVAARISELRDLSRKTDSASLEELLSELRNPDQELRDAALDIISQSGNRAAIPGLTEAAAQTDNESEKKAIVEAIEFLELPTLTEVLSQANAQRAQ